MIATTVQPPSFGGQQSVKGFDGKGPGLRQELFLFSTRLHDANWAGDHETRSSTTGFTFIIGGAAVIWGSNLQKTVALSKEKAE